MSLIKRLEEATKGSMELDGEIALLLGWTHHKLKGDRRPYWRKPGVTEYFLREQGPPAYTYSVDAALTLVPEGMRWGACHMQMGTKPQPPRFHGWALPLNSCLADDEVEGYSESTPAIALCIAALKARGVE